MIEPQPAEQTMPQPNWPPPGVLHPCTPLSIKGDLGTVEANGARNREGVSSFHQGSSCKAYECRMLVPFLDPCAYVLI